MDRDPSIIQAREDYFIPERNLLILSTVSIFPVLFLRRKTIGLLESVLLLFHAFFTYPYVLIHEFGHVLVFFFFYPDQTVILIICKTEQQVYWYTHLTRNN